ncbi:MAG: hypothetical protein IJP98_01155, partial [Clostridia bacterium]|nr:hypothetical protein [Clostridia bacterium]
GYLTADIKIPCCISHCERTEFCRAENRLIAAKKRRNGANRAISTKQYYSILIRRNDLAPFATAP